MSRSIPTHALIALLIGALITPPVARAQIIWYVDDDAPNDPGPGDPAISDPNEDGSAAHPFDAIQEAIGAAADDDEVRVADGTYSGDGNRDLDFGGRAITVRSDSGAESCIIDCEVNGRGFYFHSGETDAAIVDGFTITNGLADGSSPGGPGGGGVYCRQSSPTIANCLITFNEAGYSGGGVYCDESGLALANCVITQNTAGERGGGVYGSASSPTISNCTITSNTAGSMGGGGVRCRAGSNLTITDCTIAGNTATTDTGGIYCDDSDATISGCTITENAGAGIHCYGSSLTVSHCTIAENTGSGVYCHDASPTITDCTIAGNSAQSNGGAVCCIAAGPLISDCTIVGNTAGIGGGAICCDSSSPAHIHNCTIAGNSAESGSGGGICCAGDDTEIVSCVITGNAAGDDGGGTFCSGGALVVVNSTFAGNDAYLHGGGIASTADLTIFNSSITGNTAWRGGGLYLADNTAMIGNCQLAWNTAVGGFPKGGGVCCDSGSDATIANCVLWEDYCPHGPEIALLGSSSTAAVWYSDMQGGEGEVWVEAGCTLNWEAGNIDADPLFVGGANGAWTMAGFYDPESHQVSFSDSTADWSENELAGKLLNPDTTQPLQFIIVTNAADTVTVWADAFTTEAGESWVATGDAYQVYDYHLGDGSPCIDAGDNGWVGPDLVDLDDDGDTVEALPVDLDGNPRFLDDPDTPDSGNGMPPIVDLGAYEFPGDQGVSCPGDLDGDGDVDLSDLAILLAHYGMTSGAEYGDGDLDGDGDVDLTDLAELLAVYGTSCP